MYNKMSSDGGKVSTHCVFLCLAVLMKEFEFKIKSQALIFNLAHFKAINLKQFVYNSVVQLNFIACQKNLIIYSAGQCLIVLEDQYNY